MGPTIVIGTTLATTPPAGNHRDQRPVPERPTVCGLPPPLSAVWSVPVRAPLARGVNVTPIEHDAPAPSAEPHVVVLAKSAAFAPVIPMFAMLRSAVPMFVTVTVLVALVWPTCTLPKDRLAGKSLTTVPVPVSDTVWGLPDALSVIVSDAARVPWARGLNVTLIVQFAPAATLDPQLLVCEKSAGFAPAMVMLVILSVAEPVLVSVTGWAALDVPTSCVLKKRLVADSVAAGPDTVWVMGGATFGLKLMSPV